MLPEDLSRAASLTASGEKLSISVFCYLDRKGSKVGPSRLAKTVIQSAGQLSYGRAQ